MILDNNRSTKLGTLICSAHARTVRTADRPASGPDRPRAQIGAQQVAHRVDELTAVVPPWPGTRGRR
jgi:hypothetical protein